MNAPRCQVCGAIITNPHLFACMYCHAPVQHAQQQPHAQQPYPQQPYPQQSYGQPGYGQVYGQGQYQVQPWASPPIPPQQPWYNRMGGGGFWGVFWWIRLGIAIFVLLLVGIGSCVSALSH